MAGELLKKADQIYEKLHDTTKHCDCLYALVGVLDKCGNATDRDLVIDRLVQIEEESEGASEHKTRDKLEDEVSSLIQQWGIIISLRA